MISSHSASHGIGSAADLLIHRPADVASTADEVKDPQKTMLRALIAALVAVTGVYVLVALAALGTQPWQDSQSRKPPAIILDNVTHGEWASIDSGRRRWSRFSPSRYHHVRPDPVKARKTN